MIQTALAQFLKYLLTSCFKCDIGYAEMHNAFYSYIQLSPNEAQQCKLCTRCATTGFCMVLFGDVENV